MPPKPAQANKLKKKKLISEETSKTKNKEKEITGESGTSTDNESELSDVDIEKDTDKLESSEKYDEVEDDDVLGDEGNEVDDEDEGEQLKSDSTEEKEDEDEPEKEEDDNKGDECLYRFSKKKKDLDAGDEDIDEDFFFEDDANVIKNPDDIYVPNDQRITKPVLTKYERVRILGDRSRQISLGAKPMIKGLTNMDPKEVARLELQMKVVPMILIRTLPTGKKERWRISELSIVN